MTVKELSREQLTELKQHYLMHDKYDESIDVSWGELADIDNIIPDEEVFEYYVGYEFTNDDFACTAEIPQF